MTPACCQLFEYASRQVTPKDVSDYCPGDPGYPGYVQEFTAILSSGIPPSTSHFDISETVGLTRWADADRKADPTRFRWFRTFTNSVGVAICTGPEGPDDCMPPNYFGISLLDDAHALRDPHLLQLLSPVFAEIHQRITETECFAEEAPFFVLGQLVLAFMGFAPSADISGLSRQLISEAAQHARYASPDFVWGCTFYNQLHDRWKHFVELSFPSNAANDSIASLRNALLSSPTNAAKPDASADSVGCES